MRYDVQAPEEGHNGEVAGVRFYRGKAVVDDSNRAALAYFRRRGYALTPQEPAQATDDEAQATDSEEPERPSESDRKPAWVAYVAQVTDLSEAEAGDMTKAELIELADTTAEEEQS